MKIGLVSTLVVASIAFASGACAGVCDYKPSSLVGKTTASVGTAIAGGGAAAGIGMKAAGYYTLVHAGSGLTMLGSTAAGVSGAGTVGIIAGTAGAAGTIGAILMAPVTVIVGGITLVGVGAFEGACYFSIERVTDPYKVREITENIALQDDTVSIVASDDGDALALTIADETELYLLRNLYIADGYLMHRDFGPNTNLGQVLFSSEPEEK
ncbi:hypothetical protein [Oceaniglobus ichthyenteri]|uniref:hypothetical protein n=1 Tax=Oceaniglobus ichthyenteri TaxID=2136177 RepID=UPI000F82DA52|nr:hypothetical protein [Oceaniglobus ichthyenteri]